MDCFASGLNDDDDVDDMSLDDCWEFVFGDWSVITGFLLYLYSSELINPKYFFLVIWNKDFYFLEQHNMSQANFLLIVAPIWIPFCIIITSNSPGAICNIALSYVQSK